MNPLGVFIKCLRASQRSYIEGIAKLLHSGFPRFRDLWQHSNMTPAESTPVFKKPWFKIFCAELW